MKILAVTPAHSGVRHYRTDQPHNAMERNGLAKVDFAYDTQEAKRKMEDNQYDLVHFHTALTPDAEMASWVHKMGARGTKVVMDLDDDWKLPKRHHLYNRALESGMEDRIRNAISLSNAITVATEHLKDKVISSGLNKKVYVIPNAIDFTESQWNKPKIRSERFRYGLLTGSSHKDDVAMLDGLSNRLRSKYKDRIATVLCGYDLRGSTTLRTYLNKEFIGDLKSRGLMNISIENAINKAKGNLHTIKGFPKDLADKYSPLKLNIVDVPLDPKKNIWYFYESILTDNFRSITTQEYKDALHRFLPVDSFGDGSHTRIFSKDILSYGDGYRHLDLPLAPLVNDDFNMCKSELKLLEAGAYSLPIVCSEVKPYMSNIFDGCAIRIPNSANQDKRWAKAISSLIESPQMGADMGGRLHEVVREHYNADKIAFLRAEIYDNICKD